MCRKNHTTQLRLMASGGKSYPLYKRSGEGSQAHRPTCMTQTGGSSPPIQPIYTTQPPQRVLHVPQRKLNQYEHKVVAIIERTQVYIHPSQ